MTIEHVLADVLEPGDPSPWKVNSEGWEYLPYEDDWLRKTGVLYALNCMMGTHGINMADIWEREGVLRPVPTSLGIHFRSYTNAEPLIPDAWNDPRIRDGHRRWNLLIKP